MNTALSRRTLLRGTGVTLALPFLEAFADSPAKPPMRMFIVHAHLGFYPATFWPENAGEDYELPRALKPLQSMRDDFTIIQGMTHPGVKGGHGAAMQVLTGTPSDVKGNGISVDQLAAETVGEHTRFASIQMGGSVSVNRSGVKLPGWGSAPSVYKRLFMRANAKDVEKTVDGLRQGRSILDAVRDQARRMETRISSNDKQKLDEYFTSVRQVERRLEKAEAWAHQPMPEVPLKEGQVKDIPGHENLKLYMKNWGDLARLALQTDSSRVVCWDLAINQTLAKLGFTKGWHGLTHTEKDRWGDFDVMLFTEIEKILSAFAATEEQGERLLDNTMILFTSPLGDAARHTNTNMPALIAGGPFKHGKHLKSDAPYANLFLTMLQSMGLEVDRFSTSSGTLNEIVA